LKENDQKNGLKWKYKYYEEETHGSAPLPSEYDAFKFIFDFYRFNAIKRLTDPKFNGDSALAKHFENISKQMGYKVFPPEPLLNDIGYGFLISKDYERAYGFLKMNVDNHPKSWNCFDSMGDWYVAKGEKQKAIEYFSKAIALNNAATATKDKLNKLLSEK
jgi:tetratricopeptide (TPR) repeat protein